MKGFFDTLNANRDALIVGHNFLSFDVPFILLRALKLGITPPLKFLKIAGLRTQTAMKEEGIYDSYFNFCNGNGSGLYTPCGPSLGDLDFFLGVKPPINGGAFGRAWEQPDPIVRQALISYNMQNIWEIYLLMAASGVGAQMGNRTAIPLYETSITSGVPWIGSDVEPLPEGAIWVKKPDRPNTNRVYCGVWTAPKADFMATGPSDSKGWGRVISEETKASSPFTTQRLHPFGMQVVGGFIQDENGFHYVLNSKDESRAILETVALFKTVSDRPCFAHSAGSTRAILAVRSMKYGFSMPAWFAPYFKGKEWLKSLSFPDELSVASFSKSRGWLESGMEEAGHPPLWLDNADSCRFLDRAESQARAALQYISSLRLSHDADFETEPAFISKAA